MIFAYQRYEVEASPAFGGGLLYRPEIPLRVIGQTGDANFFALVDTGADGTLIPRSLGERIGVDLDDSQPTSVRGFSGQDEVLVVPGRVTLELRQGSTLHRWETTVALVEFVNAFGIFLFPGYCCRRHFQKTDSTLVSLELFIELWNVHFIPGHRIKGKPGC